MNDFTLVIVILQFEQSNGLICLCVIVHLIGNADKKFHALVDQGQVLYCYHMSCTYKERDHYLE